ncbi:hypothetical protein ACXNAL_16625 [Kluyvera ascorbata]
MLNELSFNGKFAILPPPARDVLDRHANFLKNHCNVPLGHALQMVAYFHHYANWAELSTRSSEPQDQIALDLMSEIRQSIQAHRNKIPEKDLLQLEKLKASIGTLTRATVDNSLMQLNDYDLIQLHNHLYEYVDDAQFSSIPFAEALYSAEHCLVLLAKMVTARGYSKIVNPHIYFPWFAFRMYGYLHVNGDTLDYDCRELDTNLFPSMTNHTAIFARKWFVNYVTGFIRTQLQSLNKSGYKGRITFSRICNEGLIETMISFEGNTLVSKKRFSLNKNSNSDEAVSKLIAALLDMGATIDEKRQRMVFLYGNGELY